MGRAYSDIAFTPAVRAMQSAMGSRDQYRALDTVDDRQDALRAREIAFIETADHFFQATVSETGWPYVQHRGGPRGFLKVIDQQTLGFADYSGNRQYISVGNLKLDDRISIIIVDHAAQVRLKLIGRAHTVDAADDAALMERVRSAGYPARIERAIVIRIEGYDWNCPQHITPRFTQEDIEAMTLPLRAQLQQLKQQADSERTRAPAPNELGQGPLALRVTGIGQQTPRVRSYELRSADGSSLPAFEAGAHLDVPVLLADGSSVTRSYSIASDPRRADTWQIAVLREASGRGGSAGVHDGLRLGMVLHCSQPRQLFPLHRGSAAAILIGGGIGITPIKAMAHDLQAGGRDFALHYAVRSRAEAPFLGELQDRFAAQLSVHAADEGQRLDIDALLSCAPPEAIVYVCGPGRLIDAVRDGARRLGMDDSRIRFERFAGSAVRSGDAALTVTLRRSGGKFDVPAGVSILDTLHNANVQAPASCRIGNCGSCAVKVLDGVPDHRDGVLDEAQRAGGLMCICVSRAEGEHLTLDL